MSALPYGWTLDAGALIAYESGKVWMREIVKKSIEAEAPLTVPATALAEVWRNPRSWALSHLLGLCEIEPLTERMAKRAGELMSRVEGATTIDATVAVSAAQRGDTIITSDPMDFLRLADDLRGIRVWGPRLS